MHTTFMQDVAVNGEDGRNSSLQDHRLLPASLSVIFPHNPHPLLSHHCHLHAAVEFSLPFYTFPFPPNFGHMVLQSIYLLCCVHCCPLLGTTEGCTDRNILRLQQGLKKIKNRISRFCFFSRFNKNKAKRVNCN